jgi:hypothetical protein
VSGYPSYAHTSPDQSSSWVVSSCLLC